MSTVVKQHGVGAIPAHSGTKFPRRLKGGIVSVMTIWAAAGVVDEAAAHSAFTTVNFASISTNITTACTTAGRPAPATAPISGCADCHTGFPTPLTTKGSAYKGYYEGIQNAATLNALLDAFCPAPANQAPTLTVPANPTVTAGSSVNFSVSGTGPEAGQTVSFSATGVPAGATFNGSTGAYAWASAVAGTYNVAFTATDNGTPPLSSAAKTVTITVTATPQPQVNHAPNLTLAPSGDRTVTEGQTLSIAASANDPDSNPVTITATPLPGNATFVGNTLNWTPTAADVRVAPYPVTFTATDQPTNPADALSVTQTVNITVLAAAGAGNQPPVLGTIASPQNATIGQPLAFMVTATDPDDDTLELITSLPDATVTPQGYGSWRFAWTPAAGQTNTQVTFTVKDAEAQDSQDVFIFVNPAANNTSVRKLEIEQARWNAKKSSLLIRGEVKLRRGQRPTGLSVKLSDDDGMIGEAPVGRGGHWKYTYNSPVCIVHAELDGRSAQRKVKRAPADVCPATTPTGP